MKELAEADCHAILAKGRVGVMALAADGAAHAFPLFFAYDGQALYFHSRPGDKDPFLDGTSEGCFIVLEVQGDDDWTSVQVKGQVQRIASNAEAERAMRAMAENPFPPEFGVTFGGAPNRSSKGMYLWSMTPTKVTGRSSGSLLRVKSGGRGRA